MVLVDRIGLQKKLPQLSCYNPEIFRAAAMGAYAGDAAFNGVGYNNGCGCGC